MIQYIVAAGIGALLGSSGKKSKKMGHGGKTQGYDSRLDESLSMRHGAGRRKQQTRKDRRDESAAMERSMGRRKYASVGTMDIGDRMMAEGGQTKLEARMSLFKAQEFLDEADKALSRGGGGFGDPLYVARKAIEMADAKVIEAAQMMPREEGLEVLEIVMPPLREAKKPAEKASTKLGFIGETQRAINKVLTTNLRLKHGGKTQGYNSRLDESLSMRHGAGRRKQQSRKDRRDESAGMERSMGRRKYASVSTMDKGRRKMAHGGQVPVPDYLIDELSSQTTMSQSALQQLVKRNHFSNDDVVSIISGIGRGQIEPMDVAMAWLMGIGSEENEELVEFAKSGKAFDLAHGGIAHKDPLHQEIRDFLMSQGMNPKNYAILEGDRRLTKPFEWVDLHSGKSRGGFATEADALQALKKFLEERYGLLTSMAHGGMHGQGYDDKLDESLGMRKGAGRTKKQSRKDRRDESAGMEKSMGRRKYASVGTMDKGRRKMAHGGKVEKDITSDEDIAKAEFAEDYGVDMAFIDDHYLGEYDSPEDWAADFTLELGGIDQFNDFERFLSVDDVGLREWALGFSQGMGDDAYDMDEDELEDKAEQYDMEVQYARDEANGKLDDFRDKLAEAIEMAFVEEVTSMSQDEIIDELGSNYGMSTTDMIDNYILMPNFRKLARELEYDGYVFIRQGFNTYVFQEEYGHGGRTHHSRRFRKGGKTKRKKVSDFDKLAMKVAARYRAEGKSNKKAMEIGRGTAAKVFRQQQAKKR